MNLLNKTFNSADEMETFISKRNLFNIHRIEKDNGEFELDYAEMPDVGMNKNGKFTRPDNRASFRNRFGKY